MSDVFPYQRDVGPVDEFTIRVVLAGGSPGADPFGTVTDPPATLPADATAATMIALLKAIANKNFTIDGSNTTISLAVDDLERLLDRNVATITAVNATVGSGASIELIVAGAKDFLFLMNTDPNGRIHWAWGRDATTADPFLVKDGLGILQYLKPNAIPNESLNIIGDAAGIKYSLQHG